MSKFHFAAMVAAALAVSASPATAQTGEITIGISISTTGPAAALGIPERNALDFVPKEIAVRIRIADIADGFDVVGFHVLVQHLAHDRNRLWQVD